MAEVADCHFCASDFEGFDLNQKVKLTASDAPDGCVHFCVLLHYGLLKLVGYTVAETFSGLHPDLLESQLVSQLLPADL